jgi:hypothetical protein
LIHCEACEADVYPVQDMQPNHTLVDTCPDCSAALGPVDHSGILIRPIMIWSGEGTEPNSEGFYL